MTGLSMVGTVCLDQGLALPGTTQYDAPVSIVRRNVYEKKRDAENEENAENDVNLYAVLVGWYAIFCEICGSGKLMRCTDLTPYSFPTGFPMRA